MWSRCLDKDPRIMFGQRLRSLRKERSLSQEDLALEAGLDRTYVSGIEIGKRNVALLNIFKLAKALDLSPGALFEFEQENQAPMQSSECDLPEDSQPTLDFTI